MTKLFKNPYLDVNQYVNNIEISSRDVLYETVDARSASTQNITFDLDAKGDNSLLCADVYVTAHFTLKKTVTAAETTVANIADINNPRDRVAFRNNFLDELILNSTFNYNGTAITERPYINCKEMMAILDGNNYQRKYGGVGGSYGNLSGLEDIGYTLEPVRGQLIRKAVPGVAGDGATVTGADLKELLSGSTAANYGDDTGVVVVDNNSYDDERSSKIFFFKEKLVSGDLSNGVVKFSLTFPLRLAPFKGSRRNMWYRNMSNALPFVKNSSINLQLKQGPTGCILEQFFLDRQNRLQASNNNTANPDFTNTIDYTNSKLTVEVDSTKNWQLHMRWYQSPSPLKQFYNLPNYRIDTYVKDAGLTGSLTAGVERTLNKSVISDLIRVGTKPEYLLVSVNEDILNNGRGNVNNFHIVAGSNDSRPGYLKAANVEIKSLDLQINNKQGVLTSSMSADALKFYTMQNVCKDFAYDQETFKKFRNFVLIKTSDIAGDSPAGVLDNCSIRLTANLGHYSYNTTSDGAALTAPKYNLNIALIYTHTSLMVTQDGVQIRDQNSSKQQYDSFVIKGMDSQKPMKPMGVSSSYKPLLQ